MYDTNTKILIIKLYKELPIYGIYGIQRKKLLKDISNVHHNTIYNWLHMENVIVVRKKYKNIKITDTIEAFILHLININPTIIIKTIKNRIKIMFNVILSTSTIYYILKNNKITYKKTKTITNPYSIYAQKEHLLKINSIISTVEQNNIISIDETSIQLTTHPSYGWSKKGKKCLIKKNGSKIRNKRYTVIMATSNKKIIDFKIVEKGAKSSDFIKFMKKLKRKDKNNKNIFLMDNAIIHKTKQFYKYAKEEKINVLYNVPYHSETNPIEIVFSSLKNEIKRNANNSTYEDIIKILVNFLKTYPSEKLNKIYKHAFSLYINNGL